MARYFRLAEAEAVLDAVREKVEQAVRAYAEVSRTAAELKSLARHVADAGGVLLDRKRFLNLQGRREALGRRLRELVEEIHALGCQVKDLEQGLVDFPTRYRGREVLLCWRLGEPKIAYWHAPDEGFAGRKPIDEDFLAHHEGDPPV